MKKLLKWIAIVAAIFIITAWAVGSYLAVDDLSHCEPTPSAKKGCHEADAVVAVSGGDTKARTAEAIKLFKNGWGEVLIFSGAAADKTGPSNARVMAEQAIVEGVPPTKIIIEETSETTLQNAVQTSSIIKDNNIRAGLKGYPGSKEAVRAMVEHASSIKFEMICVNISFMDPEIINYSKSMNIWHLPWTTAKPWPFPEDWQNVVNWGAGGLITAWPGWATDNLRLN